MTTLDERAEADLDDSDRHGRPETPVTRHQPARTVIRCPVCRRTHHGPEALLAHLTTHSHLVLAETLLERVMPCGKRRFNRQADAERALVINTISLNPNRKEVRAYKCVQCHPPCWHLTSEAQRTQEVAP